MSEGRNPVKVGDIEVVALFDGTLESGLDKIPDPGHRARAEKLAAAAQGSPFTLEVYAFLVKFGERLALVDSGAGTLMGPRLGQLPAVLGAAGIEPRDIGHIFMTHLHRDHFGGLTDASGGAAFPNAEIVLHETEAAFWFATDEALLPQRAQNNRPFAHRATAPYRAAGRFRAVPDGGGLPGIEAMRSPGHTPGHTCWKITSRGRTLLAWGDTIHVPAIHLFDPHIAMEYDLDAALAADSRAHILDLAAREEMLVAGAHLNAPAIGRLVREGGGYRLAPEA
ncbi:MAG TPA: MBL fold metallo-hydrolase [Beijerinckiaceae bacterium]|nr:MBL fold metallo-hydrolase [Beijerinckiaceae bacterium]